MRTKDKYIFFFILLIFSYLSYRYSFFKQRPQIEITRYYGRSGTRDPKGGPYLGKLLRYQDSTNINRFCREVRYDSDNQTILYEKQFSYKGNKLVSIKEDKGGLTSYINYEYDNVGHLIKETHIDNNQKTFHTVNYLYENDTLKSRTDYDANNNEIARYIITHVPGGGSDVTTIPENLPDSLAPFFYKPMGEGCYIRSINHQTGQWHYHRQYTGEKGTAVSETRNGMSCGYELDGNGNYAYYEETIKE